MYKYRVSQVNDGHDHYMLQDNAGQFFLVRTLSPAPPLGAKLDGVRPHLGFGILSCEVSGRVYRVIFEAIGMRSAIMPALQQRNSLN